MNINKDSWHVKLHKWMGTGTYYDLSENIPITLCGYFWYTIAALLKLMSGLVAFLVVGGLALYTGAILLSPLYFLFASYTGWHFLSENYYKVGLPVLIIFWIIIPTATGFVAACKGDIKVVPHWMKSDKPYTPVKSKQPSLVWEYIKAKKSKVCPIVKLEEK